MHLLPINLGKLADLAEDCTPKFSLGAIQLRLHEGNTFTADATDTKALLRISGPCVAPASDFPDSIPALLAAPNGQMEALVPAATWKKNFAAAKKLTGRIRTACLQSLAVKIGDRVTTFGATDGTSNQCETVENLEGKFPPVDDILDRRNGAVRASFAIDPLLLANLLKTIAETTCNEEDMRVEFEVKEPHRPITIQAENRLTGIRAHAIIMPLGEPERRGKQGKENRQEEKSGADSDALRQLEKQLGLARAECDTLKKEKEELLTETIEWGDTITRLREELRQLKDQLATPANDTAVVPAVASRPLTRAERLARFKPKRNHE